jgi:branched-chain amino acid transport system substrate-binding protein
MVTAMAVRGGAGIKRLAACAGPLAFSLLVAVGMALGAASPAAAQTATVKIALPTALTGSGQFAGRALMEAVRFAVDEANAETDQPRVVVQVVDDRSTEEGAREAARQIAAGDALVVVGPNLTVASLAAVSLVPTAHGDDITKNATSFRTVISTGEIGVAQANYLYHVLGGRRAIVLYKDNGYGQPFAAGVKRVADRLDMRVSYHPFTSAGEREALARAAAAEPGNPAILLGMTFEDAVPTLVTLRRAHASGIIFGTATMARAAFSDLFADQPEYRRDPGFFTDGVYAVSPVILDSANAETLAFAARYAARTGQEPSWEGVQGYEVTRLAVAAARAVVNSSATSNLAVQRAAVLAYLRALNGPAHAGAGLAGPLWFTPERTRQQAGRIGRFHGNLFESAPLQLVPARNPEASEIADGTVLDLGSGQFARRQQVVYTGLYINEISRLDIAASQFSADLYLWVRYPRDAGQNAADPTDIDFPDLVRGSSDGKTLAAQGDIDDGTTYRLWRMRGDFKNDFDLHHFPADRQTLSVRLFNSHAASERVVYVQDRRTAAVAAATPVAKTASTAIASAAVAGEAPPVNGVRGVDLLGGVAAGNAFRKLTQWEPDWAGERRDNLVTHSALGDPRLVGVEGTRELSGFSLSIEVRRRVVSTLAKSLLPLGLMALIMFSSLYFPPALVKEKVTVAITAALSGAVLLAAVNAQLGSIGYIIAVEYGFYIFFLLCLLCVVSVLTAERLRAVGRQPAAALVERSGRYVYQLAVAATVATAWIIAARW